ncbi:MAG: hypothetical protein KC503_37825 [Myxococcales bacterium]|nr:hypothetical protein [Myxococcales bacterium]
MSTRYRLFAGVAPGLETLLADELAAIGADVGKPRDGGVEIAGERELLWQVARDSRLVETLRVRVGQPFVAQSFEELTDRVARLALAAFLPRDPPELVTLRIESRKSRLYHERAVAERVIARLRERGLAAEEADAPGPNAPPPRPEHAPPTVWLRIVSDRVQVSVDAGGPALFKRGYRRYVGEAPLRETLAAACLRAADYDGSQPLWDPFCGAATILLEASAIASGLAPGAGRVFAFERWPTHDAQAYAAWRESLPPPQAKAPPPLLVGSDVDRRVLAAARKNTGDLPGGSAPITLVGRDFAAALDTVPRGAAVVTNPPYGHRLSDAGLKQLFQRFGKTLQRRTDLDPVVVLSGNPTFVQASGLRWRQVARTRNRGIGVSLLRLER